MSSSTMDIKTQASTFKDVKGKYYFPDGKVMTLTAPEGSYDSKTKNVKLKGGVTATTSDEAKLTSKELEWVSGKSRLIASGEARISQPGMKLEAVGVAHHGGMPVHFSGGFGRSGGGKDGARKAGKAFGAECG